MPRVAHPAVAAGNAQRVGELLRATAEAGARTPEAARIFLGAMDPDVVFDPSRLWPDAGVFHGHKGIIQFFDRWLSGWEEYDHEVVEAIESGEYVIVMLHEYGKARTTGIRVEHVFAQLWGLKDGMVTTWCAYRTKEEALSAAREAT